MAQTIERTAFAESDDNGPVPCSRCGIEISFEVIAKRRWRGNTNTECKSCNSTPQPQVRYGDIICRPWDGDFDLDAMQPMKDGKPYKPGFRICGHSDCVRTSHVLTNDQLTAERHSISYRTGVTLTYKEFLAELKKEAH